MAEGQRSVSAVLWTDIPVLIPASGCVLCTKQKVAKFGSTLCKTMSTSRSHIGLFELCAIEVQMSL